MGPGECRSRLLAPGVVEAEPDAAAQHQCGETELQGHALCGREDHTNGAAKDIGADKEVILAAGAIGSPKLLMLSGVGDANALRGLGIDVVASLPGVGENLQDHILVSGVVFKYKGKMPERPADSNAVEAEAYLSSGVASDASADPSGDTDINLVLEQLPALTPKPPRARSAAGGRIHDCAGSGAADQQRLGPSGQQQIQRCRRDRWQLSRHRS